MKIYLLLVTFILVSCSRKNPKVSKIVTKPLPKKNMIVQKKDSEVFYSNSIRYGDYSVKTRLKWEKLTLEFLNLKIKKQSENIPYDLQSYYYNNNSNSQEKVNVVLSVRIYSTEEIDMIPLVIAHGTSTNGKIIRKNMKWRNINSDYFYKQDNYYKRDNMYSCFLNIECEVEEVSVLNIKLCKQYFFKADLYKTLQKLKS